MGNAKSFIQDWVREHVNAGAGFPDEAERYEADRLADRCATAALADEVSREELDAAAADMIGGGDDLADLIFNAMEEAVNNEIQNRAAKDD